MDYLKQFVIPFVGLSVGNHQFEYEIDETFFASFEYSDIQKANVHITLDLNRQERMLVLNFSINGKIGVICDRCLDAFDFPVSSAEEFFVKFGPEHREEDDNVLIIKENETHIDIAPLIYDYLILLIPYQVMHPEDANGVSLCNPEVLSKLKQFSSHSEADPRWDALKNLNLE